MLSQNEHGQWSITRRLFWIGSLIIAASTASTIAVSKIQTRHLIAEYLSDRMIEEMVIPLTVINKRLDQLTGQEAALCCKRKDFRNFLSEINIAEGKVFLIAGATGYEAVKGSLYLYSAEQLISMADSVIKTPNLFELNGLTTNSPNAVAAVKLPGGAQTGHLVYIRPIDNLSLITALNEILLEYQLITVLLISCFIGWGIWLILRQIRVFKKLVAKISWNNLNNAEISIIDQPIEFIPLLNEFNRMLKRMSQSSDNQRIFAAALSHEFRTPATVISGFIQSVLNKPDSLNPEQIKALEIANSETLRLTRLLSDLLDLSRADNNQLQVKSQVFDLSTCIAEVIGHCQILYDNKFLCQYDKSESLFATGDSDRLKQCLANIISNASKYSPPGSLITIDMKQQGHEIEISVVDVGEGIARDQQSRVFQRFKRADGAKARSGTTSSGLGLAIVKMLMEAMHGSVEVYSELGKGSCFRLRLPAYLP